MDNLGLSELVPALRILWHLAPSSKTVYSINQYINRQLLSNCIYSRTRFAICISPTPRYTCFSSTNPCYNTSTSKDDAVLLGIIKERKSLWLRCYELDFRRSSPFLRPYCVIGVRVSDEPSFDTRGVTLLWSRPIIMSSFWSYACRPCNKVYQRKNGRWVGAYINPGHFLSLGNGVQCTAKATSSLGFDDSAHVLLLIHGFISNQLCHTRSRAISCPWWMREHLSEQVSDRAPLANRQAMTPTSSGGIYNTGLCSISSFSLAFMQSSLSWYLVGGNWFLCCCTLLVHRWP